MKTQEKVVFRLLQMPCCGHFLCWVNPRFPTYCPECGTQVFLQIKACVMQLDDEAVLTLEISAAEAMDAAQEMEKNRDTKDHYLRIQSYPPYVGGDDDEIDEWQAVCDCGYSGRKWKQAISAHMDLVTHANEFLTSGGK